MKRERKRFRPILCVCLAILMVAGSISWPYAAETDKKDVAWQEQKLFTEKPVPEKLASGTRESGKSQTDQEKRRETLETSQDQTHVQTGDTQNNPESDDAAEPKDQKEEPKAIEATEKQQEKEVPETERFVAKTGQAASTEEMETVQKESVQESKQSEFVKETEIKEDTGKHKITASAERETGIPVELETENQEKVVLEEGTPRASFDLKAQVQWKENGALLPGTATPTYAKVSTMKLDILEKKAGESGFTKIKTVSLTKFQQWNTLVSGLDTTSSYQVVPQTTPEGYSLHYIGYANQDTNIIPAGGFSQVFTVLFIYPSDGPAEATLERIAVTQAPAKTAYVEGQVFDKTGMKVTAYYSDGKEEDVTASVDYSPKTGLTKDTRQIQITYTNSKNETKNTTQPVTVSERVVSRLEVASPPSKTSYEAGEHFDKAGLSIKAFYNDGTEQNVTSECTITPDSLTTGLTEVTASYGGKSVKITGLTVKAVPVVLQGIRIVKAPSKVSYVEGQVFDKTGIQVKASYSDGTEEDVTSSIDYEPKGALAAGTTKIQISYTNSKNETARADQAVTVVQKALERLELEAQPNKKVYIAGESFDKAGMLVKAVYNDGSKVDITASCTITPDPLTAGLTEVTVTYSGKSIQVTGLTVTAPVTLLRIAITRAPNKVAYVEGQLFEAAGMKVTAYYSNGTEEDVTAKITYSPNGALTQAVTVIQVSYKNDKNETAATSQSVSVAKKAVARLELLRGPNKKAYLTGESFDKTGMSVQAVYNDETTKDVTADCIMTPDPLTEGVTEVTASYGGQTVKVPGITVTIPVTLVRIEVTKAPDQVSYVEGQRFDPQGMVITAYYSNGREEDVTTDITFSPNGALTKDITEIQIHYRNPSGEEKDTKQGIQVVKKAVERLKLVRQPDKKAYLTGESFDKTGMKITAYYNDGTEADVTAACVIAPDPLTEGLTEVTVSYGGHSIKVTGLTVTTPVILERIAVTRAPYKVSYVEGQRFDPAGMVVTAYYSTGREENVTPEISFRPQGALTEGITEIEIMYSNTVGESASTKQVISVSKKAVERLELTREPDKKDYLTGESFDKQGMEIQAVYNDGTTIDVTAECIITPEPLTEGLTEVTASYGGQTVRVTGITVTTPITLERIEITRPPHKVSYVEGQLFEPSGMEVTAYYSNGRQEDVTTDIRYSPAGPLTLGIREVQVSYTNDQKETAAASQTISIAPKAVSKLEITREPDKKQYLTGESFDKTGMIITAVYNDGTEADVTAACVVTPDPLTEGLTEVTISYGGRTTKVTGITVTTPVTLERIEITKAPDKVSYVEGQHFDQTGMKVTAYYSDGGEEDVTAKIRLEPQRALLESDMEIVISYINTSGEQAEARQGIQVSKKMVSRLAITREPDKKDYLAGEHFDKTGMEVTAFYNDGAEENVTAGCIITPDPLTEGLTEAMVSYGGQTVKVTGLKVTVPVTLERIELTKAPDKVFYVEGQSFDPTGMEVTAVYSDGRTENVTVAITYHPQGALSVSDTEITILYTNMEGESASTRQGIQVVKRAVERLDITHEPDKKDYKTGDSFDKTGLEITAVYNDGTTTNVTAACVITPDPLTEGLTEVTAAFGGQTVRITGITVTTPVTLDRIAVTKAPAQVSYVEGQSFDPTGMEVTAYYSNGRKADVTAEVQYSPQGALTEAVTEIQITYTNTAGEQAEALQTISVSKKAVSRLELTSEPDKKDYQTGESFDKAGMEVTAFYNDGTEENVTAACVITPDPLTEGVTEVTASFGGQTMQVTGITVTTPVILERIVITKAPDKVSYVEGQSFDPTGMEVTAYYSNGREEDVTAEVEYSPQGALTEAETEIQITYTNTAGEQAETRQAISVSKKAVSRLELTREPDRKAYQPGESFDAAGMEVTAFYNDGTEADVTADCIITPDPLTEGLTEVTVSYGGRTVQVTGINVTAPVTLERIAVIKAPDKVSYVEGQLFEATGMEVAAYYSNGATEDVTAKIHYSPEGALTTGVSVIQISYTNDKNESAATSLSISVAPKAISHLELTSEPDKKDYQTGESFDKTGMEVTAYYNDGTEVDVTSDCVITPDPLTEGVTEVTVSYGGQTIQVIGITVTTPVTLERIAVTKAPDKVSYVEGQSFDPTGIEVTAYYSNGREEDVTAEVQYSPQGALTEAVTEIQITYTNTAGEQVETRQAISVSKKAVGHLELTSEPDKKDYQTGESFDPTGMEVTAFYNDGTQENVTAACVITPDPLTEGVTEVTVSFGGQTMQVTGITVTTPVILERIVITKAPDKVSYVEGQSFDPTGMEVTAYYSNGREEDVTAEVEYSPQGALTEAETEIQITYTNIAGEHAEAQQIISVSKMTVSRLEITREPDKKAYQPGESFDAAGMEVTAFYNDGTEADVTTDCIMTPDPLTEGLTEVTVSYGGQTVKVTGITVTAPVTLERIAVTKSPDKLSYVEGQLFEPAGMEVTAYYSNGTSGDVTTKIRFTPAGALTVGIVAIQISYTNEENESAATSQPVSVAPKAVSRLELISVPDKKDYQTGESFDKTGMEVTAYYNDGTEKDVTTDCVVTPDPLTEGLTEVTVSYGGQTIKVTGITVTTPVTLEWIVVTKAPAQVSYVEGQSFDPQGMEVTAYYSNGREEEVTADIQYSPQGALTEAETEIRITYTNTAGEQAEARQAISVSKKAVSRLEITNEPDKKDYQTGESFAKTGMKVTAFYNDGTEENVTEACVITPDPLTEGLSEVTVSYGGQTIQVTGITVTTPVTMERIEVTKAPDQVSYVEGESFDPVGMEVTAYYSNGREENVTAEIQYSPHGALTEAVTEIQITYANTTGEQAEARQAINVSKKAVSRLELTSEPDKKDYKPGESFDKTGMEVTAFYNDGTEADVTEACIITPDPLTEGLSEVAVSYGGQTIQVTGITVITPVTLEQIAVTKAPDKVSYVEGQLFEPDGMEVTAYYSNGTQEDVTAKIRYRPAGALTIGVSEIQISYTNNEDESAAASQPISVAKKAVSRLELVSGPNKKDYQTGESFDVAGMEVAAYYNDGTEADVTTDCVVTPDPLTEGLTEVTVSYGGQTIKVTGITVTTPVILEGIAVTKAPDKVSYIEGQSFDPLGMAVTAFYSNGTREDITSRVVYDPHGALTTGTTRIEICYVQESGTTFSAYQNISVSAKEAVSIAMIREPDKKDYVDGETFDRTGMVVKVTYNDGTTEDVTGQCMITPEKMETGMTEVTLSFGGKSTRLGGITVTKAEQPCILERIELTKKPEKVSYVEGQKFNPTGMKVTAVYSDGKTRDVTDQISWRPKGSLSAGQKEIVLTFTDDTGKTVTTSQRIQVSKKTDEKTLSSLQVTKRPDKTVYENQEKFDRTGMKVTAVYDDGSKEEVGMKCTVTPETLTTGLKEVKLSYQGKTVILDGLTVKEQKKNGWNIKPGTQNNNGTSNKGSTGKISGISAVRTGDPTNITLAVFLFILAGLFLAVTGIRYRKKW